MDENTVPFGSQEYYFTLSLLVFARGMDLLSTRVATPNLIHEANPIARRLGWKWGSLFNLFVCFSLASWPLPGVVVMTTSLLVAARNFRTAWMMRALGEERYRALMSDVMEETSFRLYLLCLMGETSLTMLVGAIIMYFSGFLIPFAIGLGVVAYGAAVGFYTTLSVWGTRHRMK